MAKRKSSVPRSESSPPCLSPVLERASRSGSSSEENEEERLPSAPLSLTGCVQCRDFKAPEDNHTACYRCSGCSPDRPCPVCSAWDSNVWMAVYFGVSDTPRPKRTVTRSSSRLTSGGKRAVSGESFSVVVSPSPVDREASTRASLLPPRSVMAIPPKAVKKSHVGGKVKIPPLHANLALSGNEGYAQAKASTSLAMLREGSRMQTGVEGVPHRKKKKGSIPFFRLDETQSPAANRLVQTQSSQTQDIPGKTHRPPPSPGVSGECMESPFSVFLNADESEDDQLMFVDDEVVEGVEDVENSVHSETEKGVSREALKNAWKIISETVPGSMLDTQKDSRKKVSSFVFERSYAGGSPGVPPSSSSKVGEFKDSFNNSLAEPKFDSSGFPNVEAIYPSDLPTISTCQVSLQSEKDPLPSRAFELFGKPSAYTVAHRDWYKVASYMDQQVSMASFLEMAQIASLIILQRDFVSPVDHENLLVLSQASAIAASASLCSSLRSITLFSLLRRDSLLKHARLPSSQKATLRQAPLGSSQPFGGKLTSVLEKVSESVPFSRGRSHSFRRPVSSFQPRGSGVPFMASSDRTFRGSSRRSYRQRGFGRGRFSRGRSSR